MSWNLFCRDCGSTRLSRQALRDAAAATRRSAADLSAALSERVGPVLSQAAVRVAPYADEAAVRAKAAKAKAAGWAAERVEQLQPGLYSALDRVPPAVDKARGTLEDSLIPGLVDALHGAAGTQVQEVAVVVRRRQVARTVLKVAGAVVVVGAAALVLRTWLARPKESQWSAHETPEAYVYPDDSAEASPRVGDYETDSYIGTTPPEGFVIKANARSKKYHLPGMRNYDRTIAEVWFATEEAAEAAGFTKAEG
ncbi:MAG: hypothetical protein LBR33_06390 [Propionibacteriaceae bacterium]|jgi:hypothetical protein|nr:hypothetical protein [Propionibacteriaceae bacterium]